MRILAALAALLALACPLVSPGAAQAAIPGSSCPDVLIGDSLAVGMGPYARAAGFEVVARTGIGLAWLRAQNPRCARRMVVVIGTNDLRGLDPWSAEAYPARLAAILARWQAQEITWATPGCFPYDERLERGSEALEQALAREPLVRVGSGRDYMRVHSGRPARCSYLSGDGIHPSGTGYRAWWASLSQAIGPAPGGEEYREARAYPQPYASRHVRAVQHGRSARLVSSARPMRPGQQARAGRPDRPQMARPSDRSARSVQQARLAHPPRLAQPVRPNRAVEQARADRTGRVVQQARIDRTMRPGHAARPDRAGRAAQQAHSSPPARSGRDLRPSRLPVPSRQAAAAPIRRT